MRVKATLTGAELGAKRAGKIPAEVKRATRNAVTSIVRGVARDAKAAVRRKTGLLAKSIGSVVRTYKNETTIGLAGPKKGFRVTITGATAGRRAKAIATTAKGKSIKLNATGKTKRGAVLDSTRYGHLVEKGTKRSRRYPFLGPAAVKANAKAKSTIVQATASAIKNT